MRRKQWIGFRRWGYNGSVFKIYPFSRRLPHAVQQRRTHWESALSFSTQTVGGKGGASTESIRNHFLYMTSTLLDKALIKEEVESIKKNKIRKAQLKKLRRTSIPKKKKVNVAKQKKVLWELCKQLTRTRYGNRCFTCRKTGLVGSNWHTGHFLASATCGAYLRYDLRNLRPQCFMCNITLGGNGAAYYRMLVAAEGQAYVDQLFRDKNKIVKADTIFYGKLIESYQQLVKELQ